MSAALRPDRALNRRQREIAAAVVALHTSLGRLPTRREIARALNRAPGGYLDRVVAKLRARHALPRVSA